MIIDLIDDRLVLQKINSGIDTTINDNEFSGNYWIKDGDELIVSDKRVQFKISLIKYSIIELNIENVSGSCLVLGGVLPLTIKRYQSPLSRLNNRYPATLFTGLKGRSSRLVE